MTTKQKLSAIHKAVDRLLENKMPATVSDHVCDALDALAAASKAWEVDWEEMRENWNQGIKLSGEPVIARRIS